MVPTLQITQLATWHATWAMIFTDWDSSQHYLTELNRTLAPLQHPPWLWLPGLSQTLLQMKNCSKTTCFSSRATTFATSSSTVFAMAASLAPPAMEQSDGVWTSWCNLSLILRVCHSGLLWILESQKGKLTPKVAPSQQSWWASVLLCHRGELCPSEATLEWSLSTWYHVQRQS